MSPPLSHLPLRQVLAAAYPWVARRLLTERSPELRATLRALLYKQDRFNFERMESLMVQAVKPVGRRRLTPRPPGTGGLCWVGSRAGHARAAGTLAARSQCSTRQRMLLG